MDIQPYPDSELWILAANVREADAHDIGTTHSEQTTQNAYEKCWTGEGWGSVASASQRFETRQEAEEYLEANRAQMERA